LRIFSYFTDFFSWNVDCDVESSLNMHHAHQTLSFVFSLDIHNYLLFNFFKIKSFGAYDYFEEDIKMAMNIFLQNVIY